MSKEMFSYLEKDYKNLSEDIKDFDKTIFISPHSAIIKGRIISENIILEVAKLEEINSVTMMPQVERLRRLKYEGILDYNIYDLFQQTRLIGNKAAHSNVEGELESALTIHKNIYKIIFWFIESYVDYRFVSPTYKGPIPSDNKVPKLDEDMISDLIKTIVKEQITDKNKDQNKVRKNISLEDPKVKEWDMKCLVQELSKLKESSKEAVEGLNEFTDFKKYMHIEREAQKELQNLIINSNKSDKSQLILVSGSVGDGKSHIISYFKDQHPEIMNDFILHNDATESLEPDKTSTDTLNDILDEFSDDKIEKSNKKLILAINLGTLNNFIDSEYGKRFSILKEYVHEKKIIETSIEYNGFNEESYFQFVNFGDYHIFTLKHEEVNSEYIETLISKITDNSEVNIFYESYKRNCIGCKNYNCCPVKSNYEFLSNQKVKKTIVDLLVQAVIKSKIIISTRALINFIYELIVPIPYIDVNSLVFKDNISKLHNLDYIKSLMPNLIFSHKELSFIFESLSNLDPIDIRNQEVDNFIIEFNNSTDILFYFEEYIDFPEGYLNKIENINFDDTEDEDTKQELLKLFVRSYYIYGESDLFSLEDVIYQEYMRNIYILNRGDKQNLKSLYDNVKNGILKWNGEADKDQINIFIGKNQTKYKISEKIDLKPDVSSLSKSDDKLLRKFNKTLKLRYKTSKSEESYKINIDFALYKLLVQINNGYRPNKKDKNQFVSFIEFINKLEETGSQKEKLIFTEKNRKINREYRLEYDSEFEIYKFMESTI